MYQHLTALALATLTIAFLDGLRYFFLPRNIHRWFWLHLLVNCVVAGCALPDLLTVMHTPPISLNTQYLMSDLEALRLIVPKTFTLMLHIYHIVMFRNLQTIDWVHHIVMCSVLILILVDDPATQITNSVMFFVNGLPGGLDYLMLLGVKMGKISPLTEKRYNSLINAWLRAPGILWGIFCGYANWRAGNVQASGWMAAAVILSLFWNAQYFAHRVAVNYGQSLNKNGLHKEV